MARFEGDPALVEAIHQGVRELHRKYEERGNYDSHDLINWLNEHRNAELNEIYDLYHDCSDPEMTADQQIGKLLDSLGQKKIGVRESERWIARQSGHRNGTCQVSVWSISSETALGNPDDRFASLEEKEEFEDFLEQKAIHRLALRNAIGRAEDLP